MDFSQKIEQLTEQSSEEFVELLANAKRSGGSSLGRTAFVHVVDLCLADAKVEALVPSHILQRCRSAINEYLHRLNSVSEKSNNTNFLEEVYLACSSFGNAIGKTPGTGFITSVSFLVGVLAFTKSDDSNAENNIVLSTRDLLTRHGLQLEVLVKSIAKGSAANVHTFRYEPLGFGEDLTSKVLAAGDGICPLIGMEEVLQNIMRRLPYRSVCLTGEKGVGKSALVKGLAWHLATGSGIARRNTRDWRIIAINRMDLLAGTSEQGALESRLKEMLNHFQVNRNVIPFFDEVHVLLNAKDPLGSRVINILKPPMADGSFRVIAATTDKEYGQFIMPDEPLSSRFSPVVFVPEPTPAVAAEILTLAKHTVMPDDAGELGVTFPDELIPRVISLTNKYQKSDSLPRKGFDLLRSTIESKCYDIEIGQEQDPVIDDGYLVRTAQRMFGVSLARESAEFWPKFQQEFLRLFPANAEAGTKIAAYLMRQAQGLVRLDRNERTPLLRIWLAGGNGSLHVRIRDFLQSILYQDASGSFYENMAQYREESARYKLVGAPPGYVGHEDTKGTTIFAKIKRRPQGGVFHIDNLHQMHPSIATELVALLEGQAKDSLNFQIDLSQWLVVLSDRQPNDAASDWLDNLRSYGDVEIQLVDETSADAVSVQSLLKQFQDRGVVVPSSVLDSIAKADKSDPTKWLEKSLQEHFESQLRTEIKFNKTDAKE